VSEGLNIIPQTASGFGRGGFQRGKEEGRTMLNGGLYVLFIIVAALAGAIAGYVLKQIFTAKKIKASESLAARIVE